MLPSCLKDPKNWPQYWGSVQPLRSYFSLESLSQSQTNPSLLIVRVTSRAAAWQGPQTPALSQVPEDWKARVRSGLDPFLTRGWACPCDPLLTVLGLGWHPWRGGRWRSGGLFEVSSGGWWQRVQLTN